MIFLEGQRVALSLRVFDACIEILSRETADALISSERATLACVILDQLMQARPQLQLQFLGRNGIRILTECCASEDGLLRKAATVALMTVCARVPQLVGDRSINASAPVHAGMILNPRPSADGMV